MFSIDYSEGAAVGYKWFDARKLEPLFPFGHGLSYTRFAYSRLKAAPSTARGSAITVSFTVRNTGRVAGMDVPQIYVAPAGGGWEAPKRLGGFKKISLAPGESRIVTLGVDPRLLATFSGNQWRIAGGQYRVMLGASSRDLREEATVRVRASTMPDTWRP